METLTNAKEIHASATRKLDEIQQRDSESVWVAERELVRAYWELRYKAGEEHANKYVSNLMSAPF